jgi:hypothetical protein
MHTSAMDAIRKPQHREGCLHHKNRRRYLFVGGAARTHTCSPKQRHTAAPTVLFLAAFSIPVSLHGCCFGAFLLFLFLYDDDCRACVCVCASRRPQQETQRKDSTQTKAAGGTHDTRPTVCVLAETPWQRAYRHTRTHARSRPTEHRHHRDL